MSESQMFNSQDIKNKRVLLRADLNIKSHNKKMTQNYKLTSLLPTIDELLKRDAKVVIATHIGRPKKSSLELSTKQLMHWFEKKGYTIVFEPDLKKAHEKSLKNNKQLLLLENLRFFPGEQSTSQYERDQFINQLTTLADLYVNDAFGVLHRNDASITDLPKKFEPSQRTFGPLIQKELAMLDKLLGKVKTPFLCIIGGKKATTKVPIIEHLLDTASTIALCPALVFTFLKVQGEEVNGSKGLPSKNKRALSHANSQGQQQAGRG